MLIGNTMPYYYVWVNSIEQFNYLSMNGRKGLLKYIKRSQSEDFLLGGGTIHQSGDR